MLSFTDQSMQLVLFQRILTFSNTGQHQIYYAFQLRSKTLLLSKKQLCPIRKKHEEYVDIPHRKKDVLRNETSLTSRHTRTPRYETALGRREVICLTIIAVSACLPDKLASGSNQSTRRNRRRLSRRQSRELLNPGRVTRNASLASAELVHARAPTRRRDVHPAEFKQTRCLRFLQSSSRTGWAARVSGSGKRRSKQVLRVIKQSSYAYITSTRI